MIIFLKLLLAHFIGDFLLQPKSWVEDKEKHKMGSLKLYMHILFHGALVLLFLFDLSYWQPALLILISHGLIDIIKLYLQKEETKERWFSIDQALHILIIFICWYIWFTPSFDLKMWYRENQHIWVYATAIIFLSTVVGIAIQVLLSDWAKEIANENTGSLRKAGKYIGVLERLLTFTFIVIGQWEVVGFLLAAKSIFRFGDLNDGKDRKLTEYVLIGTLLSFGIAIITGIIVLGITTGG